MSSLPDPSESIIDLAAANLAREQAERRFWRTVPRQHATCSNCHYSLEGLDHSTCPECNRSVEVHLVPGDAENSTLLWTVFGLATGIGCYGPIALIALSRATESSSIGMVCGLWVLLSGAALIALFGGRRHFQNSSLVVPRTLCRLACFIQGLAIALPWWLDLRG